MYLLYVTLLTMCTCCLTHFLLRLTGYVPRPSGLECFINMLFYNCFIQNIHSILDVTRPVIWWQTLLIAQSSPMHCCQWLSRPTSLWAQCYDLSPFFYLHLSVANKFHITTKVMSLSAQYPKRMIPAHIPSHISSVSVLWLQHLVSGTTFTASPQMRGCTDNMGRRKTLLL